MQYGLIGCAMQSAAAADASGAFNNLVVYTPMNGPNDPCGQGGSCVSQEFFGMVPEGGAVLMYLLLAGVTCFGAIFYSQRRTAMGRLA